MSDRVITNVNLNRLSEEGERIYHEKLKPLLEPQHRGKIVAIEVDSGDYFMDDSVVKAGLKAKTKYPDKVFHFVRVGYRAVHKRR
ncbi:hypothetical protein L0337_08895 [candidate division KSB1 bacterium]|nr:hypothetical protein [candidate division KSB1 bacterium]